MDVKSSLAFRRVLEFSVKIKNNSNKLSKKIHLSKIFQSSCLFYEKMYTDDNMKKETKRTRESFSMK